jgi:nucleoside-diphosphate-sugar epimerase
LIPIFLKRALCNQPLLVAGMGTQARSFVYVEDLARAHVLGLQEQCANQTFNLDGPRPVSVLEVAEAVRALVGRHVAIEHTPGRPGDYSGKLVLQDKSARMLGWVATIGFEEGMRRTFEWYRAAHGAGDAGMEQTAVAS